MPYNDKLCHTIVWHFNSFSGTQLIFSRAGPSAAFLWVPFLSPPKEMEQITSNNLQIAQKFVANGYDVFLLSNPNATKSADFIIKQKNKVFYVEGKTSSGGSALSVRLSEGAKQANRIVVNLTGPISAQNLSTNIKHAFEHNENLQCMYIFKGARLIFVKRKDVFSKTFFHILLRLWSSKK